MTSETNQSIIEVRVESLEDFAGVGRTRGRSDLDDRGFVVGGGSGGSRCAADGLFALRFIGRGLLCHRNGQGSQTREERQLLTSSTMTSTGLLLADEDGGGGAGARQRKKELD